MMTLSIIGISGSICLASLFLSKWNKKAPSVGFLGLFFLLLSIRLGKLPIQEFAPYLGSTLYFNLMHSAYLAMGPVIWFYIYTYSRDSQLKNAAVFIHFLPSIIFLLWAHQVRQLIGDGIWLPIYWVIQVYPVIYLVRSLFFLKNHFATHTNYTRGEKLWVGSVLAAVSGIVGMNILYFTTNFPFYLVTAALLIITVYLLLFLAFNDRSKLLLGKSSQKYKSLKLNPAKMELIRAEIDRLLMEEALYLNDQIKVADLSDKLNISPHLVSGVINKTYALSFPQHINNLRIQYAQRKLIEEYDKKIIIIALESGFSSLSAFNRAFKLKACITPSAYRQRHSKKMPDL